MNETTDILEKQEYLAAMKAKCELEKGKSLLEPFAIMAKYFVHENPGIGYHSELGDFFDNLIDKHHNIAAENISNINYQIPKKDRCELGLIILMMMNGIIESRKK